MSVIHARNVLTGTLTNYVLLGVTIVLGIYLMPFTMRHLGQAEYGLWILVASMTAYFQLFDLGYGNGVVRHITAADASGDVDEVNTVLSTFVVVYSLIGLAVLAVTGVLIFAAVPRFPTLTAEQVVTAQYILAILGIRIAIGFPMGIFGAVTTARQRFSLTSGIAIVVVLLQGLSTYAVLTSGHGVIMLVAATAGINIVSYAAYAFAARRTFPEMRIVPSRFSAVHVREVSAFSLYLFVISIAIQVGTHVDNLIVGGFLGTTAVAVYTVAMRLSEYHRQLCGQFSGFLFPLIVRYHADKDGTALRTTLVEGTRIGLALATLVALGMVVLGRELIQLWMGPGFEAAVIPLYILAGAGIVMVAQGPTGNILLGTGQHRMVAAASVAEILMNVGLSIALIGSRELIGVAIGTAIPYVLINAGWLMPAACRVVRMSLGEFFRATVTPSLAGLVPAAVVGLALRTAAPPASITILFAEAFVIGLTYLAGFWIVGLSRPERRKYLACVRELWSGALPAPTVATS
jgi:O-antigen/teichoic acid export membrane protein